MWTPGVPGTSVLAVDPGPGGREAREGELGADKVDLGAEDTRDQQAEDRGQGEITSGYLALSRAQGVLVCHRQASPLSLTPKDQNPFINNFYCLR